jgi:adenylate kinase family enzyme
VQRISVVGNSGSGKTTLARALAAKLEIRHLELDAVNHQADWQQIDPALFAERVREFTAAPGWVVDGNYSAVRGIVWGRADTVIWLDLPRWLVMRRVIGRTLRRLTTRAELWNGNRERWRDLFSRENSIVLWAWTSHPGQREKFRAAQADPANAHLRFVRLRTRKEIAALMRSAQSVDRGDVGVAEVEAE